MENKKLTKKEIESILGIQKRTQEMQNTFGAIAIRELELNNAREVQEETFTELRTEEAKLAKKLEDKYGSGNIDLDNGVFIPHPSPTVTA